MSQSRLERIEASIKALEARRKNLLAGARQMDRKEQSRRKYIIGHILLANCLKRDDQGEKSRAILRQVIADLRRPADIELFTDFN